MADGVRRARRKRSGSGARSLAQAEAELSDDVRRRLRARSRVSEGWVPSAPGRPEDGTGEGGTGEGADPCDDEDRAGEIGADHARIDEPGTVGDAVSTGSWLRAALRHRLPVGLRGADVAPSRAAVAGLAALLAAALLLALVLSWLQRPHESAVPSVRRSVPAGAVVTVPATATPSPDLVVHVTGAVRRPGLVELPSGARVDDAVAAAGGATRRADLASVNLARLLVDGEQIVVLRRGATPAPGAPTGGTASPGQPVDLNTATLEQLDGLPGVGPVLAQRILDWRTAHGRFSSVDELTDVSGIGEQTLADVKPLVHV